MNCKLIPCNPNALIFLFNINNKLFKRCLFSISMSNLPLSCGCFGLSLTFYSLLGPIGYTRADFLDIHLSLEYIQTCILIQIDLFFHKSAAFILKLYREKSLLSRKKKVKKYPVTLPCRKLGNFFFINPSQFSFITFNKLTCKAICRKYTHKLWLTFITYKCYKPAESV